MRAENKWAIDIAKNWMDAELLGRMKMADEGNSFDTVNYLPIENGRQMIRAEFKYTAGVCAVAFVYEYGNTTVVKHSYKPGAK